MLMSLGAAHVFSVAILCTGYTTVTFECILLKATVLGRYADSVPGPSKDLLAANVACYM